MGRSFTGGLDMPKMNVTEKDFEAFFQAVETISSMAGGLEDDFNEEAASINRQFKNFKRRYIKALSKETF